MKELKSVFPDSSRPGSRGSNRSRSSSRNSAWDEENGPPVEAVNSTEAIGAATHWTLQHAKKKREKEEAEAKAKAAVGALGKMGGSKWGKVKAAAKVTVQLNAVVREKKPKLSMRTCAALAAMSGTAKKKSKSKAKRNAGAVGPGSGVEQTAVENLNRSGGLPLAAALKKQAKLGMIVEEL